MTEHGIDFSQINGDMVPGLPSENGRLLLLHDLARRFETPDGMLGRELPEGYPWDKTLKRYGHDLRQYINAAIGETGAIERRIVLECRKDERVSSAEATMTIIDGDENAFNVDVKITDEQGPFSFTIGVSKLSVSIFYEGRLA